MLLHYIALLLCQRPVDDMGGLFLGFLACSIDLSLSIYLFIFTSTTVS